MQVVIEIDERYYEIIKNDVGHGCDFKPFKIIANGTPLPKGHGRLKDVDWIDDNCEDHRSDKDGSWCYVWRDIDSAPTIIEADKESEGEE